METTTKPNAPMRRPAEWRAFNGHMVEGDEISFDNGKSWRTEGWSATHSDSCSCSEGDSDLEGFAGEEY